MTGESVDQMGERRNLHKRYMWITALS